MKRGVLVGLVCLLLLGCKKEPEPAAIAPQLDADVAPAAKGSDADEAQRWNLRGALALQQKKYRDGVACFEKALSLDPENADYLGNLGRAWFFLGEPRKAERLLREAMSRAPRNVEILSNYAELLESRGDDEGAVQLYYRVLDVNPGYVRAHYQLARYSMRQKQYAAALPRLNRVLSSVPSFSDALVNRAICLHMLGQDAKAMQDVKALEANGYNVHPDLRAAIEAKL